MDSNDPKRQKLMLFENKLWIIFGLVYDNDSGFEVKEETKRSMNWHKY